MRAETALSESQELIKLIREDETEVLDSLVRQSGATVRSSNKFQLRRSRHIFMEKEKFALGLEGLVGVYYAEKWDKGIPG